VSFSVIVCLALAFGADAQLRSSQQSNDQFVRPVLRRVYEGSDGDEFFGISGATVDRRGAAIWLRHRGDATPLRIDRASGAVRRIGTQGDGPGEYRNITNILAGRDGEVLVYDAQHYRVTRLVPSGARMDDWHVLSNQAISFGALRSDSLGQLYWLTVPTSNVSEPDLGFGSVPVRLPRVGAPVPIPVWDPGWRAVTQWQARLPNGRITSVGLPGTRWSRTVLADGRVVMAWTDSSALWVGSAAKSERWVFPIARDTMASIPRRAAEQGVSSFEASVRRDGGQFINAKPTIPRHRPEVGGLLATLDGGLWVLRGRDCARVPAWRDAVTGSRAAPNQIACSVAERFDARGRRLAPVSLVAPQTGGVLAVRGDTVWMWLQYQPESPGDSSMAGFQRIGEFVIPGVR
jgi:hypothetical protein